MLKERRDETLRQIRRKNIWRVIHKTRSQNKVYRKNEIQLEEDFDLKKKILTEIQNLEELRYYQTSSLTQIATKILFRLNHIFSDDQIFQQFDISLLLETSIFGKFYFSYFVSCFIGLLIMNKK